MTNLLKISYLFLATWLLLINPAVSQAADLTFTPVTPTVQVNQSLTLTVSGSSGEVKWSVLKGQILGAGNQITYIASGETGVDVVTVIDSAGNVGVLKVVVTQTISLMDTQWEIFPNDGSSTVQTLALSEDGKTLWVGNLPLAGKGKGGLEKRDAMTGEVIATFYTETSSLPNDTINVLLSDNNGGVWIGTTNGLAHLQAEGLWEQLNTDSGLPSNSIMSLIHDANGGLWIGTNGGGLAHRHVEGTWDLFNNNNSPLPDNSIWALASDNNGGIWIGTRKSGLVHFDASQKWTVFNTANSKLPDNWIYTIMSDNSEGVWLGTQSSLVHLSSYYEWTVFTTSNSELPGTPVFALANGSQGGMWIGTGGGLVKQSNHLWTTFDSTKAGLSNKGILALVSDSNGGVWAGAEGGIAHLTPDNSVSNLPTGKQAAIIIAGGGAQSYNNLWDTTEAISNYIFKTLYFRGFSSDEIYYLSPKSWADFNGDGFNDHIVDAPNPDERPLTVEDIRVALAWAKTRGKLNQPLYLFFIGDGGPNKLQLSEDNRLEASDFKIMLDDYQSSTGNPVVVVIEACYSGSFLPSLAAPNRAIISSTAANELAHFMDKTGFSRFLAQYLLAGVNFYEAFILASREQEKSLGKSMVEREMTIVQTPQLDDDGDGVFTEKDGQWLRQVYLNRSFFTDGEGSGTSESSSEFTVTILTSSTPLKAGQSLQLRVQVKINPGAVKQVWATLEPPSDNFVLSPTRLTLTAAQEANIWETTWLSERFTGSYKFTFSAEDYQGNVANSDPVVIEVVEGLDLPQQRAALIIAGGGSDSDNSLWDITNFIANYIYSVLHERKFTDQEIYYLSPKTIVDVNMNGSEEDSEKEIVDRPSPEQRGRPLTSADVQWALAEVTKKGTLNQPLYLFFIDHGDKDESGIGYLKLANFNYLSAPDLKVMLDNYQQATNNRVIVVIDACYSGLFIKQLAAPKRVVISSADANELAYFPSKAQGFSYFLPRLYRATLLFMKPL